MIAGTTPTGTPTNLHQWLVDLVRDQAESIGTVKGPWTSQEHLVKEARKLDGVTVERTWEIIAQLVDDGALFSWHGLLCPNDGQGIAAALAFERERDLPRQILIEQLEMAQGGVGA